MSKGKEVLIQWISSGISLGIFPLIDNRVYEGDLKYILSNMIAKVSLSDQHYLASKEAVQRIDPTQEYTLASLYGRSNPLQLVYEHAIPCKVVLEKLKEEYRLNKSDGAYENILALDGSRQAIM